MNEKGVYIADIGFFISSELEKIRKMSNSER